MLMHTKISISYQACFTCHCYSNSTCRFLVGWLLVLHNHHIYTDAFLCWYNVKCKWDTRRHNSIISCVSFASRHLLNTRLTSSFAIHASFHIMEIVTVSCVFFTFYVLHILNGRCPGTLLCRRRRSESLHLAVIVVVVFFWLIILFCFDSHNKNHTYQWH